MNDTSATALQYETFPDMLPVGGRHLPGLKNVLKDLGPLPRAALFLGVAGDRLPVLLNLADPVPGPVLVAGDSGSGKTRLLRLVADAVNRTPAPDSGRFAVIAAQPADR